MSVYRGDRREDIFVDDVGRRNFVTSKSANARIHAWMRAGGNDPVAGKGQIEVWNS